MSPEGVAEFRRLATTDPMLPERMIQSFYRSVLSPHSSAIDCGAHTGHHTRPLAECCSRGNVVAYEALPDFATQLTKSFQSIDRVHIRNVAIQADPGIRSTSFQFVPARPGRSGIRSATINTGPDNEFGVEELTVAATTIDQDLSELEIDHGAIDFMKLDLEGGEFDALRGARQVLQEGRPLLAIENGFHAARIGDYSNSDLSNFFHEVDYQRISVFGQIIESDDFDFWYVFAAPSDWVADIVPLVNALREAAVFAMTRRLK